MSVERLYNCFGGYNSTTNCVREGERETERTKESV